MKAMIFTAGLEASLDSQKKVIPKALIEINGEPLPGILVRQLAESGFIFVF